MGERFPTQTVIKALVQARGIKSHAADILGCTRQTVDNYINRHPTVAQAYQEQRRRLLDKGISALAHKIDEEAEWAVKYGLSVLGKDEGWALSQDFDGTVNVNIKYAGDGHRHSTSEAAPETSGDKTPSS